MDKKNNQIKSKKQESGGYTLIELIIAVAIFVIVVSVTVSVFLSGICGARRIADQQNIMDSMRYISEVVTKEIRMSAIDLSSCATPTTGCSLPTLNITNSESQAVVYSFSGNNLTRNGGQLNTSKVNITGSFYVLKPMVDAPPRVTIIMKAKSNQGATAQQVEINSQTTVASRQYQ